MMSFRSFLVSILGLIFYQVTPVLAHAYLQESVPASGSTVYEQPEELLLVMGEPVEIRFSTFKVYPLETTPEMSQRDIVLAAKALMKEVLTLRDDEEMRLDTGILNEEKQSSTITLGLKEELAPSTYVVMWRLLSIDTHTTGDFTFFTYTSPVEPSEVVEDVVGELELQTEDSEVVEDVVGELELQTEDSEVLEDDVDGTQPEIREETE